MVIQHYMVMKCKIARQVSCHRINMITAPTWNRDLNFSKWGPNGDLILSEMGTKWGPSATEMGTKWLTLDSGCTDF